MRKKAGLFIVLCTPLLLEAMSLSEFKNALFAIFTSGAMFAEGARITPRLSQGRLEEAQQKAREAAEERCYVSKQDKILGIMLDKELGGKEPVNSTHPVEMQDVVSESK